MRSRHPHGSSSGKSQPPNVRAKASCPYECDISMGVLYVATRALVPAWVALSPTLVRSTSGWSSVAGQSYWCYSSILLAFDVFPSQWASFRGQLPCQFCSCFDHTNQSWSKSIFTYSELDSWRRGIRPKASQKRHLVRRVQIISISIYPLPALTSVPFPNTATADRERQRAQDTKFNYYHYEREVLAPMTPNNVCLPQTSLPSRSSFNFFNRRRESGRKWILKSLKHMEAISISMCYLKFCAHITSGIDYFWQQF